MDTQVVVHREGWLRGALPTFAAWSDSLVERISGPGHEAKRHMSAILGGIGAIFLGAFLAIPDQPGWLVFTGGACFVVALLAANRATAEQGAQGRAADLIEWKREEQQFRRAMHDLWHRAKAAYKPFCADRGIEGTLEDLIDESGWPEEPDERGAPILGEFASMCMRDQVEPYINQANDRVRARIALGGGQRPILHELARPKDMLGLWSVALEVGGGREATLRYILKGLHLHHERSLQLVWFLVVAQTDTHPWARVAEYDFLHDIRDAMRPGSGA